LLNLFIKECILSKYKFVRLVAIGLFAILMVSLIGCSSDENSVETSSAASESTNKTTHDKEHDDDKDHAEHDHDKEHDDKDHAESEPEPFPVTVIDALGQEISFDKAPSRIATISPTSTEIVYAAGGTSILRDRASKYPELVLSLPDVGSAYNPSVETILSTRPDLVVIEALTQARFAGILGASGLKVLAVKAESFKDVEDGISNLGKILNTESVATKKIKNLNKRLEAIGSEDGRSVLILVSDAERNLYAARPESYTGLIAHTLGMENKAAGLPDSGPFPGFALMNPEAILVANPDVIITITPAPEPAPRLSATITQIPPFAGLKAIRTNSILEGDVTLFLQAPGPRIVDAVEFLKSGLESK
tara:strand:+ start:4638 stop:5726 length:1089 start_codon:yes stop_codon:yes gene_type:complete